MFNYILVLSICSSILFSNSIDDKIKALKNSPIKDKFKLMNSIKKEISYMHQKERLKAIEKLKNSVDKSNSNKAILSKDIKRKIENQTEKTISTTIENYQFKGVDND